MWNLVDLLMEGACGETSALMGMDMPDILRRSDDPLCPGYFWDCERVDAAREGVRGGWLERELARLDDHEA